MGRGHPDPSAGYRAKNGCVQLYEAHRKRIVPTICTGWKKTAAVNKAEWKALTRAAVRCWVTCATNVLACWH